MVSQHGFNRQQLHDLFAQTQRLDWVIRLMDRQAPTYTPPSGPNGAWLRYRKKFVTPGNVQNGVLFWDQYETDLQRASRVYGVPPEIIVGIIGVETRWGRVMGRRGSSMRCPPCPSPTLAARSSSAASWNNSSSRRARKAPTRWPCAVLCRRHGLASSCRLHSPSTQWTSTAMGISTCGIRVTRSAASPTISARLGQRRSRGGSRQRPGALAGGWLQDAVPAGRARFRRTTPAGSARRPPASQPAAPGHGQELPVLVRLAELLRDHPLQPQHPLRDGCLGTGQEVDRVRHRSVVRQD